MRHVWSVAFVIRGVLYVSCVDGCARHVWSVMCVIPLCIAFVMCEALAFGVQATHIPVVSAITGGHTYV